MVHLFRAEASTLIIHNCAEKFHLLVALTPLGRVYRIFRGLDIRTDVGHREALVLLTGALRTLPQVLLHLVERHLPAAVDAYILPRTDFLSGFCFLGQFDHQTLIWMWKLYMTFDSSSQTVQNVKRGPKKSEFTPEPGPKL